MGRPHGQVRCRVPMRHRCRAEARRSGRSGEWRRAAPRHVRRWAAGSGAAGPARRRRSRQAADLPHDPSSGWNSAQERLLRKPHGRRDNGTPTCSSRDSSASTSPHPAATLRQQTEASPSACLPGRRHDTAPGRRPPRGQAACPDERPRRNSLARSGAGPGSAGPSAGRARTSSVQHGRMDIRGHQSRQQLAELNGAVGHSNHTPFHRCQR